MPGFPRSTVGFCSLPWVAEVSHTEASEEVQPREKKNAGRDAQADDSLMTGGNYMIVEHTNALKLIRLKKHFCCGPAYFCPQHLCHKVSYEQKPVAQILMVKFWLRDLFIAFSVLLSKFFLTCHEDSVKGLSLRLLWERSHFFLQESSTKLRERLWR